jgi:outer membrane immunogenic protein
MKKFLVAGIAIAAFCAAPAFAADMPTKGPVYKAPVPVFSWTGCYLGAHAGYGWGKKDWTVLSTLHLGPSDVDGALAGGQVGCNYQSGSWVFGAEGDFSWANIKGSAPNLVLGPGNTIDTKVDWLSSATARAGYAIDRSLLYFKGGAAWARDRFVDNFAAGADATGTVTKSGWTIGGGYEYAFSPNWSAKIEYAYYDFGTVHKIFSSGDPYDIRQHMHTVKVGLNYRFDWGKGPVSARY